MYIDDYKQPFTTIQVNLGVPSAKLQAAAQLTLEEYKGMTEQALREARVELHNDKEFYNSLKDEIKAKIKAIVAKSINDQASEVMQRICKRNTEIIMGDLMEDLKMELEPKCYNKNL